MVRIFKMAAAPTKTRQTARALGVLVSAFGFALVVVAGAPQWLPQGSAGIDHIVLPIVVFPLIWISFVLVLYGARRPKRAWLGALTVTALHAASVASGFWR